MTARHVSPPLLNLNRAVDVTVLGGTAPDDHPLGRLLLVLLREVPKILYLTLKKEGQELLSRRIGGERTLVRVRPAVTRYPSRPW